MSGKKFVVQEAHFHIADKGCFVLIGWYPKEDMGAEALSVFFGGNRLETQVRCLEDESVQQKYARYDLAVTKEYVILAKTPNPLRGFGALSLRLAGGGTVYKCSARRLRKMQKQLSYRITSMQITGADYVVAGWAASEIPVKINIFDKGKTPVQCEVSHFPRPDVALEYRESETLADSGFTVTVPMSGRKKLFLQITDGEMSAVYPFRAVDRRRIMLYLKKAHYYMKRNGIKQTFRRAVNELYEIIGDTGNYMKWRRKNMPTQKQLEQQRNAQPQNAPLVCCITPYEDTRHMITLAQSLESQTYQNWKWVVACTGAEQEKLRERLGNSGRAVCEKLMPVSVEGQAEYQHRIAAAIEGLRQLKDDRMWVTFAAPADTFEPNAFYDALRFAQGHEGMSMVYTDEDIVSEDGKQYSEPVFKSDFNIDMLRAMNYIGHAVFLRGDLLAELGGWNPSFGLNASYDYFLRAAECAEKIGHLPQAVYHKREHTQKQAEGAQAILNAHYKRMQIPATAVPSETAGIYHTRYQWGETPLVSINIPNKDHIDDLDTCVQSVLKNCTYPNYEIVIIENNSTSEQTFDYYKKIQEADARVRVVFWKEAFNYSKITNFGVEQSNGEYILLLNNDTEVITPDFIEEMLGYCMREDVGVCGARLFYFDDTIQHAGVVVGLGGICGEGFQGFPKENGGYQNRIFCPQDYSAVTAACLMTKKSVFEEVGGMDGGLQVAYNDIDYCLKVRRSGRLVVYNPFAMLHHYEYKSRGTENTAEKLARYNREVDIFTARWSDIISAGDPYYNPNLTKRYQDFSLRRIELL